MKRDISFFTLLLGWGFVSCTHTGVHPPNKTVSSVKTIEPWKGKAIWSGGVMAALRGERSEVSSSVSCAPWSEGRQERTVKPIQPNPSGWSIHAQGVGDLSPGKEIPESALSIEGKSGAAFFDDGFADLNDEERFRGGFVDQEGFRIIRFPTLDLQARVTLKNRIFALYPGESLRTAEGTGLGSTLRELKAAHGDVSLTIIPEPYECSVSVPQYPNLTFLFRNCDWACGSQGASLVEIGGFNGDESELPWGHIDAESTVKTVDHR